jgi:hypothetical protein
VRAREALGVRHETGTRGDTTGVGHKRDGGNTHGRWGEGPHGRRGGGPCERQARAVLRVGERTCESGWLGRSAGSSVGSTFGSRWWTNGSITLGDIYIWCYYSSHRVINRYVQSPESPTDRAPRVPTPSPVHARTRPHARARNPVGKPGQLAC